MNIYRLISYDIVDNEELNTDDYVVNEKLYDTKEFSNLCNKCIDEMRKIYKEFDSHTLKQHLILHYGFKDLRIIQTFYFKEEYN